MLAWLAHPVQAGDTGPLLAGTEQLGRCLAALDLTSCDQTMPIGPYPVAQYAPDLVADAGLELSQAGRRRALSLLSGVGVVVAVAAAWLVLRRLGLPEWRWGLLLVVASGPALAYGSSTWGEMLAAGLVTLLVAAAVVPARPGLLGLAAFGAGLTKETGYPFVVALVLVGLLLARERTGASIRRHLVLGLAGTAMAFVLGSGLNVLRFGTPRNAYYLDPALRTETPGWFLELVAGLAVSPNGGIVFFWPLAVALALVTFLIGFFPLLGEWAVYIPVSIYLLVFRNEPNAAAIYLLVGVVLTACSSLVIRPKLAARSAQRFNFYWMLVGLVAGVYVFGIPGVVLGPAILGFAKAIMDTLVGEVKYETSLLKEERAQRAEEKSAQQENDDEAQEKHDALAEEAGD